ncbi:hypothetical protein HY041_04325 [Candidatus Roizmanbacteria bacterium]|nr:hypothetical protein [Candidatus Roizmanbacteria bacterium]
MQLQTISTKQLLTNLPKIIESLEKGASYTLIHRSKPVAQLNPISSSHEGLKKLLNAPPSLFLEVKRTQ